MEVIDMTEPDERTIDKDDLDKKEMKCVLMLLSARGQSTMRLNSDIADHICSFLFNDPIPCRMRDALDIFVHPASVPPPSGRCPLLEQVPCELRRVIFAEWLPAKDVVIEPTCREGRAVARDAKRKPCRNKTSDLLTLNKTIKEDMTRCVYAERIFAIHVHEGINTGGIEFLDADRQPLQYKDDDGTGDDRFARFSDRKEFGFHELKKIKITIFPATESSRHSALNTYYMNKALACMLERSGADRDIVSLTISFASQPEQKKEDQHSRRDIMRGEHWWWDPELNAPRETSIHNVTDIELALRPFAILTHVHNVSIHLPSKVKSHASSVLFTDNLKASMTSRVLGGTLHSDDRLEYQAEVMRGELFEYIYSLKYGGNGQKLANLNEEDMFDDSISGDELDSSKHDRSFSTQNLSRGVDKRAKLSNVHNLLDIKKEDDDDDDTDVMSFAMQQTLMRTFEKGNTHSSPKMGSLSSKKSSKPASGIAQGISREEINQAFDDANNFTFLSDFADETKFDNHSDGLQLGNAPISGTPPPTTELLRSLWADQQQSRRRVKAVKLEIIPGSPGPQPIDSAIGGIFSDGPELLHRPDSNAVRPDDVQAAVPTLSSNSLLQALNVEREQRRDQQRYGHLAHYTNPSNVSLSEEQSPNDLTLSRTISSVRPAFHSSNITNSNALKSEPDYFEDDGVLSQPLASAHQRIDSRNTTIDNADNTDTDVINFNSDNDGYKHAVSGDSLAADMDSPPRLYASRVTKPTGTKKKNKSPWRKLASLLARGVTSTQLSGRKIKSDGPKADFGKDEVDVEEDKES